MLIRLMMLFVFVPLLELYVLLVISDYTSVQSTILLVLVTGLIGAFAAKSQGRAVYDSFRRDIADGVMPHDNIIEGLCVIIGGALLLTPGLVTDIAGFVLVLPPGRRIIRDQIKSYVLKRMNSAGNFTITIGRPPL